MANLNMFDMLVIGSHFFTQSIQNSKQWNFIVFFHDSDAERSKCINYEGTVLVHLVFQYFVLFCFVLSLHNRNTLIKRFTIHVEAIARYLFAERFLFYVHFKWFLLGLIPILHRSSSKPVIRCEWGVNEIRIAQYPMVWHDVLTVLQFCINQHDTIIVSARLHVISTKNK